MKFIVYFKSYEKETDIFWKQGLRQKFYTIHTIKPIFCKFVAVTVTEKMWHNIWHVWLQFVKLFFVV